MKSANWIFFTMQMVENIQYSIWNTGKQMQLKISYAYDYKKLNDAKLEVTDINCIRNQITTNLNIRWSLLYFDLIRVYRVNFFYRMLLFPLLLMLFGSHQTLSQNVPERTSSWQTFRDDYLWASQTCYTLGFVKGQKENNLKGHYISLWNCVL